MCAPICDFLDDLAADLARCCDGSPPGDLKETLEDARGPLAERCGRVRQWFAICACIEAGLDQLYTKCRRCRLSEDKALEEILAIITSCDEACPLANAQELFDYFQEAARKHARSGGSRQSSDGCYIIECLLVLVRKICDSLAECIRFCRCVEQSLEDWLDRCARTQAGQDLCAILDKDCQDVKCKDPAALVDCIEERLCAAASPSDCREVESPPPGDLDDLEEIKRLLKALLQGKHKDPDFFLRSLKGTARRYLRQKKDDRSRDTTRVYYAVGMIFAGDTPGSPFGEFAVASDIARLAEELRFSLRPVFEPRSSFRELRVQPPGRGRRDRALRSRRSLSPGPQGADPRGGGPQPDLEPGQSGPDTGGG